MEQLIIAYAIKTFFKRQEKLFNGFVKIPIQIQLNILKSVELINQNIFTVRLII